MVDDTAIATVLRREADPQAAADELVRQARAAGGFDNITAIVVDSNDIAPGNPKRRQRRSGLGVLAFMLVLVLLIGGAVGGLYAYASNAAFLIADDHGYVNVYRGIAHDSLPGVNLQWFEYRTDVKVDDLPPTVAVNLQDGIQVDNLDAAAALVQDYEAQTGTQ
jgi:protein phosphatase